MIEDGPDHPDLARALKGRNPFDSRHNVIGELIQQLDYVGVGIHMQARRETLLECARLAVTVAETRAPDHPGDDKLEGEDRAIMSGHVLGCLTIRDLILELAGVEFEEIDGQRVVKGGSSLEEAVRNLVKGKASDDRR